MPGTKFLYSGNKLSGVGTLSEGRLKGLSSGSLSVNGENPLYLAAYSIEHMVEALSSSPLSNVIIGSDEAYYVKLGRWDSVEKREKGPIIGKSLPGFGVGKLLQRKVYGCLMLYVGNSKMASSKDTTLFKGRGRDNRSFSDRAILAALKEHTGSNAPEGLGDAALDVVSTVTGLLT
ncbi:MAG TPA: hypothetical protein VN157_07145 [Caulobacter sp.]|nr:hypothetical protein [Caulobacter sp.]